METIYTVIESLKDEIERLGWINERDLTEEEASLFSNAITAIGLIKGA